MTVSVTTHSHVLISSECGCDGQNKVCDAVSGQCVCPPNTIGRTCDQCNHTFWSWNETAGCQVMIFTSFYNVCIEIMNNKATFCGAGTIIITCILIGAVNLMLTRSTSVVFGSFY